MYLSKKNRLLDHYELSCHIYLLKIYISLNSIKISKYNSSVWNVQREKLENNPINSITDSFKNKRIIKCFVSLHFPKQIIHHSLHVFC